MADTPSPNVSTDVVSDLVTRYGRQAIQLLTALAGATGLFYTIGFIIVNVNLLRLGLYETALISVGYVAPGVAFAIFFALIVAVTIGAFAAWARLLRMIRRPGIWVALMGILTVLGGALLLGGLMGFGLTVALGVVIWSVAVGLGVAIMAYAEHLPLVRRMFAQRKDEAGNPLSPVQARLKSPTFLLVSAGLTFLAVLVYGQFVYDQVPPVFGGGLPIVVRFFGEDVHKLEQVGIDPEPGQVNLTERVRLIAQTEDRYIVRVAHRAVSFDKSFVQGIQYEPPDFILDEVFFLATHTKQGERFFVDERYDEALSEFELVLDREPTYIPALHGRVSILLLDEYLDFDRALDDYRTLTQVDSKNGENFYGLATVYMQRGQSLGQDSADDVISALDAAKAISPTLIERARADQIFDSLRGKPTFDTAVYGSGPAAARWFVNNAKSSEESGATTEAIAAYRRAITYAEQYRGEADALGPIEIADLHVNLSRLYRQGDPLSLDALAELQAAVDETGQENPAYLTLLADLYYEIGDIDSALATYDLVFRLSTENDPGRLQALIGQGKIALEQGDYPQAVAAYAQALELSDSDAGIWYDYARALAALSDDRTEAALRSAIELNPGLAIDAQTAGWDLYFSRAGSAVEALINGAVHAEQARAAGDQGDLETAIAEYALAAESDPHVADYWRKLADVTFRAGRYAEAATAYENAILRVAEPDAELYTLWGESQIQSGNPGGAIESLTNAINLLGDATPASTYASLAGAYQLTGAYDQAAATYQQAAQVAVDAPSQVAYLYRAGIVWLLAGQVESSQAALEPTLAQGGLRVQSAELGLRDSPSASGQLLKTISVGAALRIIGSPQASEGEVWWEVSDVDGSAGYVRAVDVEPSQPPDTPAQAGPLIPPTAP